MENNSKSDLIITALQQRIGEITSSYETQIAILRAELTMLVQDKQSKDIAIENYEKELVDKIASV
jgi:hypothetical protein